MINVEGGNIEAGADINFANIGDTYKHIDNLVASMVGLETSSPPTLKITSIPMYGGREGIELIKALISKNINAIDDNGYTPLILASAYGYTELVKELIATGANINAKSYEGISALEVASHRKHRWVKKMLRDAGATGVFIGIKQQCLTRVSIDL